MLAIFKKDFRGFFTSPIGYTFIAFFLVIMNWSFYFINIQYATSDLSSLFSQMLTVLCFIVPLLTMRLFSEELKLKTDQLLFTSPVGVWSIVLGKFFAAMSVFIIALVCTAPWSIIVTMFGTPQTASIVGNYVAVICATGCFIAIGLFISSLTESQVIAAIGGFAALYSIQILNIVANAINVSWVKTIVGWFSIFTRYSSFTRGIFSLADIVYYLSFAGVFLFLTTRVLEKKRWS